MAPKSARKSQQPSAKKPKLAAWSKKVAVPCEWNGVEFASKFERDYAQQLTKLGLRWEYEADNFYWFPSPRIYRPDFKVFKDDGTIYYVETKGFFDPNSRAKMAAIKKQFPSVDIRMAFMDPDKKVSKSKTGKTYSSWAEAVGYLWSSFCIPQSWRNTKNED